MQTTWKITEADRDAAGNIKVDSIPPAEPRSLADLLPKPAEIRKDAQRQKMTRQELTMLAAVALCAAFIVVYAWTTPSAPTTPRVTAVATLAPTPAPTIAPATPVRLLAAFAAPDGVTLGTIEATRPMTPTAHYGNDWIQAQVAGSGLIWLRAVDMPGVGLVGPDLAPRRPATGVPAPAVQPVSAPVSAPTPCTQDIAPYVVHRQVQAGTLPIGEVTGWSCTSAAEAEASASAQEQQVRANYQAQAATARAGR